MPMKVKVWGSRGSITSPLTPRDVEERITTLFNDFFDAGHGKKSEIQTFLSSLPQHRLGGYGGDTLCIEVKSGEKNLIIDAGSGIRRLGYQLLGQPMPAGGREIHMLFTHFHWDHTCGLGFFLPFYIPGNTIHLYSVEDGLEAMVHSYFKKPYFPVEPSFLGSKIHYHQLAPRSPVDINGFTVTPYQLDHPDPCWGYKIEKDGKVYSHCSDSEAKRVTRADLGADLPLYQGVDLALMDAQFTLIEWVEKADWGHASASVFLELVMREGVKRVYFLHHDPTASDAKVRSAEEYARNYYYKQLEQGRQVGLELHHVDWGYAFDGMEIDV